MIPYMTVDFVATDYFLKWSSRQLWLLPGD
jgi:hypothetical protein